MNWHSQISIIKHCEICRRADNCTGFDTNYIKFGKTLECVEKLSTLDNNEPDLYFYHSDHIGSSSFITDASGIASQHLQYLPFGELFVEQRSNANYYTPYKFSAKEKDEETSYSYFGARYYMSDISIWLSVDQKRDKYPNMSPYMYCAGNPVILMDSDGKEWVNGHSEQVKYYQNRVDHASNFISRSWNKFRLNSAKKNEATVSVYIKSIHDNDISLYNYIDKLQIGGVSAKVKVSVDNRISGDAGNVAETHYSNVNPKTGKYNEGGIHPGYDGSVGAPVPKNEDGKIGFDVTIYGRFSFNDNSLSNELFDIMYRCAYPNEAMSAESDKRKYESGGYDAYVKKGGTGSYSKMGEELYIKRKSSGEGSNPSSNPYPLKKEE